MKNKLLHSLLAVQSYSGKCGLMQEFIIAYLKDNDISFYCDKTGNIYAGNAADKKPCIIAHMDTVHPIFKGELIPVEINRRITGINAETMEQSGIGGDDKCGIYAALILLNEGIANAAFFVDEEIGCIGSHSADMTFFSNTLFCLQADRQRNMDFVTDICGSISSRKFQRHAAKYLKKYGYRKSNGMMTDVMALSDEGIGISCANMSAGYYMPHTDQEYIDIVDLENCVSLMRDLCLNLTGRYPHTRDSWKWSYKELPPLTTGISTASYWNNWDDTDIDGDDEEPQEETRLQRWDRISRMTNEEWEAYELNRNQWLSKSGRHEV